MGNFKEIDRQRQEVEEVMNKQNEDIVIPIYFSVDDDTGITHYDIDSMRDEFERYISQLEDNQQAELDGWNERMQDYAMDNMTCDYSPMPDELR